MTIQTDNQRPLLTFALFAYNQEPYVREAVAAAFAQTYTPLQIILSDDASSDATADIIREMAASYSGPHRVIVNVNPKNLGIGAHVNLMFHLAKGAYVVMSAGDDISHPDRVVKTFDLWERSGRTLSAIFCGAHTIDSDGSIIGELDQRIRGEKRDAHFVISSIHRDYSVVLGACSAYDPVILSTFGELESTLGIEDTPLAVRASLLGGIGYIDDKLVRYRTNVSVWRTRRYEMETFEHHRERLVHVAKSIFQVFRQIQIDSLASGNQIAIRAAKKRFLTSEFIVDCYDEKRFSVFCYLRSAIGSAQWTRPLLLGTMFAFPRIHRFVFHMKKRIGVR